MHEPQPITVASGAATSAYLELIDHAQRFSRRVIESLNAELDRHGIGLDATQAMILVRLGDAEVSASGLRRGCYLATNVMYSLKRLVEGGYVDHKPSPDDGRMVRIKATAKGREAAAVAAALFERQAQMLEGLGDLRTAEAAAVNTTLRRLCASLTELIVFRQI